jgi:hypothetical protein
MATTLGGVTLVDPNYEREGYTLELEDIGELNIMADGSAVYDYVDTLYTFTLSWNAITEAQKNAIRTRYLVKSSQAFSPPDSASSYTVFVMPNTWRESYLEDGDGTRRYYCEMRLREAS